MLARVRALEERLPGLQAKLRVNRNRGGSAGSGTLAGRVEALEEAMDALLQAQVGLLLLCALAVHCSNWAAHACRTPSAAVAGPPSPKEPC